MFFARALRLPTGLAASGWLAVLLLAGGLAAARADWQLTWSDEFTGTNISTNNWIFAIGNGTGGWGNNELEYYTSRPQNAYVSNGILHLVARQESYDGFNYTSAKLATTGLFSQKCGLFEFYAKLPAGQGYWPALWMMPQDEVYGGWAASGEIDVTENMGSNPTNVLGTIHFGGMYPNQAQSYGPSYNFTGGDSVTNFHLYSLEWFSNSISWYVDNQLYETQTNWWSSSNPTNTALRNPYPAPFDQSFYIIMNLAVGGNFGGNPTGTTAFPGDMQVDYVRAYTWVPPVVPPPVLKLRFPFDDPPGSTTTPSDTNGGGANLSLQMVSGSGVATDYHGPANSGVAGNLTGSRALNFTANGASQPGMPGPGAATTNASLGFGLVSNFVASVWFDQTAQMAAGANLGPRLFILGAGTPGDAGAANSLGLKFQTATQLDFQLGTTTASMAFSTNLPTNAWVFVAAAYDGQNLSLYKGTATNPATLVSTTAVATNLNFGTNGALFIGNRQDRERSFSGWLDDFRLYTGTGGSNFVESVRELAVTPASVGIQTGTNGVQLSWPAGTLQAATNLPGPWSNLTGVTSPYVVSPGGLRQFYRLQFPP